ncbi:hypothetical protein A9Q99_24125 [Gammaproteobacteria bacterium 45_16_T64]|nr:hypothetical protein A9Q99_24125 [Gammaproteobacteria bacterium 45_16_T64]
MQWILKLYKSMATPFHAVIGILGVCVVAFSFSFAGALGGFMEKFTYAVFFLYGIFLFYCAFFSRLLVEANRLEDDGPKRGNLIGLSYVYQGILIPVILLMTWWILSTAVGKANNLVITAKNFSEPLIREFEHMTMGPIEYEVDDLSDAGGTITLELTGVLNVSKPLESMIKFDGKGLATLSMSVPFSLGKAPGYEIFDGGELIELELDINNSTSDMRPYKDACYIRIPVLRPDLGGVPINEISVYSDHGVTLRLLKGVDLTVDNGKKDRNLLIGDGFVMVKYKNHQAYKPSGKVIYCPKSVEVRGKEYFNIDLWDSIPIDVLASFVYPVISKDVVGFSREKRSYIRPWGKYQRFLKRRFEDLFD